jgi:hypothetical protein
MLTEYNGQVFKADRYGVEVLLWRYTPVDGFKKKINSKGVPYYETNVGMGDVWDFFTVQFYVEDEDERLLINGLHIFLLDLISTDGSYAEAHGFVPCKEQEGTFTGRRRVTEFKRFIMVKTTDKGDIQTELSLTEFFEKWRIYKTEVGDNLR